MDHRQEMIQYLLDSLDGISQFHGPPEAVVPEFTKWVLNVNAALRAAGMQSESALWADAISQIRLMEHPSTLHDMATLSMHVNSTKAILLGILHAVSGECDQGNLLETVWFSDQRKYLQRIVQQINGSYERRWYDACAVMLRKLIESLIIECFETYGLTAKIQNARGEYENLADLLERYLQEDAWPVARNAKKSLPTLKKLKELGDLAAHNRSHCTQKGDLNSLIVDLRIIIQEFLFTLSARNIPKKNPVER